MTNFDFISEEDETAEVHLNPDYEPGPEVELTPREREIRETAKREIATSGNLTPGIIKEARSVYGLDVEAFFKKYHLDTNISLERLLLGPLDEDGNLK